MKKIFFTFACIASSYLATAQANVSGNTGSNGDGGRAYSNGYIPSPLESNQNRPDSTQHGDTSYREQKWNDGSLQHQNNAQSKNSKSSSSKKPATKKTVTTTTEKKTATTKKTNY